MITLKKPYCTLLDVQTETKNSGSENDDLYLQAINFASRYIDNYCRRDFWYHDHTTAAFKVPRSRILGGDIILPFPILSVSVVRYMPDVSMASSSEYNLSEIEYYFEIGKATISISSTIPVNYPFEGRVEVFGEFGYTLDVDSSNHSILTAPPVNLPSAVRRAATIVAAAWSNERRVEQVALDGTRSSLLDNTVSKEVFTLLECFVNRVGNSF